MFRNGKFINPTPTLLDVDYVKIIRERFRNIPNHSPASAIPVEKIHHDSLKNPDKDITQLFWFGHSTFLLQMEGKNILIDPMFGLTPAPIPGLGVKRYAKELPIAIEKLPFIGLALFIHHQLSSKNMDKKWLNWLLQGNGSQIGEALGFLKEIEEFEKEE